MIERSASSFKSASADSACYIVVGSARFKLYSSAQLLALAPTLRSGNVLGWMRKEGGREGLGKEREDSESVSGGFPHPLKKERKNREGGFAALR